MEDFPYLVEYASTGGAKCGHCRAPIEKELLRLARYVQSWTHDIIPRWYHSCCFVDSGLRYPTSTVEIGNFDNIRWKDQQKIKHQIEALRSSASTSSEIPWANKRKIDSEEKLMKEQNELLFAIRDQLEDIPNKMLDYLLFYNNQRVPEDASAKLNTLADAMAFGALKSCNKCTGHFEYISSHGYKCTGNLTEWAKCEEMTQDPTRVEFIVPQHLEDNFPFLKSYVSQVRKRIVRVAVPSISRSPMRPQSMTNSLISLPKTMKVYVKPSGVVDPASGMSHIAHVYQRGEDIYSVTLAITCIQRKKNSFYILQILKHNDKNLYYLFRKWGRIGTNISDKNRQHVPLEQCIEQFENLYADLTGNKWSSRKDFVKVVDKMYPVDTDYHEPSTDHSGIRSTLNKPVQDLMRLIFDVHMMKKIMREYDLDLDKMPLGKLSTHQFLLSYRVLTELLRNLELMKVNDKYDRMKLIDASNRFYTLVPHSFGTANPPILDSKEAIMAKCNMIDSLLEMEMALNILGLDINSDGPKNPLDTQYEQLNTEIDVLDKNSVEYNVLSQYVKNTHGPTHENYELDIEEIFIVRRQGEDERYARFRELHNRKLLWHGSRINNYAGILSQGLRIAPNEAPRTGYMFGKGIYFADMVSKSANYCLANRHNPTGLLLLCEVALGNISGRLKADYFTQLPDGAHSIMGLGKIQPAPAQSYKTEDGVEIPFGKPERTNINGIDALLYNEYVVYNPDQVKARFLVKVNFKFREQADD